MEENQVNYWDYLKIPQLLTLQNGLDSDDAEISTDELSFIIIHQVFELWFKLTLCEVKLAIDIMSGDKVNEDKIPIVVHHLKRTNTIFRSAIKHFDLMETLIPQDFLKFRSKLGTASGFQSFQMRELEIYLGLSNDEREKHGHGDPLKYLQQTAKSSNYGDQVIERLEQAINAVNLRDAIWNWLYRTPIQGSNPYDETDTEVVNKFIQEYLEKMREVNELQLHGFTDTEEVEMVRKRLEISYNQSKDFLYALDIQEGRQRVSRIRTGILFIESFRELPLLSWPRVLIDTIVELEELLVIFRFRHSRMVERIIGKRVGTGGSSGVDYLDQTTKYRIFPELGAVRTLLLPIWNLPIIENEEFYDFTTNVKS